MSQAQRVVVEPALKRAEITFLGAFSDDTSLRRVWPGQPSRRSPWRPTADGQALELIDEVAVADPETVSLWLRFLSREFLAPSSSDALERALSHGLRGGHRLSGEVVVAGVRRITVNNNRVDDRPLGGLAGRDDAEIVDISQARNPQAKER